MKKFTKNRYSKSYVGSFYVNSESDMAELTELRESMTEANKKRDKKMRVVVRGRDPIEKKIVHHFLSDTKSVVKYDKGGNIVGGLSNATRYDVYIYPRN